MAYLARNGVVWAKAFLEAGEPGARLAEAFLSGREDLPERILDAVRHGDQPIPFLWGADPFELQEQLHALTEVTMRLAAIVDPRLRLAVHLGMALDHDLPLRHEFGRWAKEQATEVDGDVTALGDEVGAWLSRPPNPFIPLIVVDMLDRNERIQRDSGGLAL